METITVKTTKRCEFVDVTSQVKQAVEQSGIQQGFCMVYVPHTTAGVTINENADPDVPRDILSHLEKLVPRDGSFRHSEGNSDGHIKSSLMGCQALVPVQGGKLVLGTWQGIFFCEFDGPRNRRLQVSLMES